MARGNALKRTSRAAAPAQKAPDPACAEALQVVAETRTASSLPLSLTVPAFNCMYRDMRRLVARGIRVPAGMVGDVGSLAQRFQRLQSLRLEDEYISDEAVAQLAALTSLTRLDLICCSMSIPGATLLSALTGLRALNIDGTDAAVELWPALPSLARLSARGTALGPEGAAQLAAAGHARLEDLRLRSAMPGTAGCARLAALRRLTALHMQDCDLADAHLAPALSLLPELVELDVSHNRELTAAALQPLTRARSLRRLNLSRCPSLAADWDSLVSLADLDQLRELDISHTWLLGDEVAELAAGLTGLERLSVAGYSLAEAVGSALGQLPRLQALDARGCRLDTNIAWVVRLTGLTSLALGASDNLGADAAAHIATLTGLLELDVCRAALDWQGARHLATLTRLTSLAIAGNDLRPKGVRQLHKLLSLQALDVTHVRATSRDISGLSRLTGLTCLQARFCERRGPAARRAARPAGLCPDDSPAPCRPAVWAELAGRRGDARPGLSDPA